MRKSGVIKIVAIAAMFFLAGTASGWSFSTGESWLNEKANSDVYYVKAGSMFLRGLHRVIEFPVEIGYHTYDGARNHLGYGEGILKGLGTGLLWGLDDLLRGIWDIATALFPDYHGEPGTHSLDAELHGGGSSTTAK